MVAKAGIRDKSYDAAARGFFIDVTRTALRMPLKRIVAALLLLLCIGVAAAQPVKQTIPLTQYRHLAWRIQDGAFDGTPLALAQTPDGYVWIGTSTGLVRFDGVRFVPFPKLGQDPVMVLHTTRDGTLWIGTDVGVVSLRGDQLQHYADMAGYVNAMAEDSHGDIWFTRSRVKANDGALCTIRQGLLKCFGTETGLSPLHADMLAVDGKGDFWLEQPGVLRRWNGVVTGTFSPAGAARLDAVAVANALLPQEDGTLLVGLVDGKSGLQRMIGGALSPVEVAGLDLKRLGVNALMGDLEHSLWIGTEGDGLIQVHDGGFDRFAVADGLSGNRVAAMLRDADGSVWIATNRGLDCFLRAPVLSFSRQEGLVSGNAFAITASRDGGVWVGGSGLTLLQGGRHVSIGREQGLPGVRVNSLLDAGTGPLWVGVDGQLYEYSAGRFTAVANQAFEYNSLLAIVADSDGEVFALRGGRPVRLYRVDSATNAMVEVPVPPSIKLRTIAANPRGGLLVGADGALYKWRRGTWETVVRKTSAHIHRIVADRDDSVWAVTFAGLFRWKDGQERVLDAHNGLPCDVLYAGVLDRNDNLWVYGSCGLMRLAPSEVEKWWNHPGTPIAVRLFDVLDGAIPGDTSFAPAATRVADGRLWFVNNFMAQSIDPQELPDDDVPLPIKVEEMVADHDPVAIDTQIRIAALTRLYEFRYTGGSPSNAQRLKFRYWLEGQEPEWQEVGNRREAFYNDLAPGKYRFHVSGRRGDGAWSKKDAVLEFVVLPAWYQTAQFRAAATLMLALVLWVVFASRLRAIRRDAELRYDLLMAERTRMARDLHDTLLQTIQASKMVADVALDTPEKPELQRRAIEDVANWLNQALREGRAALNSLRLLGDEASDLALALNNEVSKCNATGSLRAVLVCEGEPWALLPIVQNEAFRIGTEAITNAYKHSNGTQVAVTLRYDATRLELRVVDDGRGVEASRLEFGREGHFGIVGMRERAAQIGATLDISVSADGGVRVALILPRYKAAMKPGRLWHRVSAAMHRR